MNLIDKSHIVCCTDDNYAPYCGCMIISLLQNGKCHNPVIHILTDNLSIDNKKKIVDIVQDNGGTICWHIVDDNKLVNAKFRKKNPLSRAAYFRILLPSILDQNINVVLYLDCDLIIKSDISYLFSIDIRNYALAAVSDLIEEPRSDEHRFQFPLSYNEFYFNSGVMLINLHYWRNNNSESQLIEFSERERTVFFHDQDALNYVFKSKWLMLPPDTCYFNGCLYEQINFKRKRDYINYNKNPKIIHFASNEKPWHNIPYYPNRSVFMEYFKKTKWGNNVININKKNSIMSTARFLFITYRNIMFACPILLRIFADIFVFILSIISLGRINYFKWKH